VPEKGLRRVAPGARKTGYQLQEVGVGDGERGRRRDQEIKYYGLINLILVYLKFVKKLYVIQLQVFGRFDNFNTFTRLTKP
jgi:hypothetical protein